MIENENIDNENLNANNKSQSNISINKKNEFRDPITNQTNIELFMNKQLCKLSASRILEKLKIVISKPKISAKRWIWELIQNAKDAQNIFNSVSIKIEYDENFLKFSHNADPFSDEDIGALVLQTSNKNSQNLDGQIGKFGTGFICTHILLRIIKINEIIKCNNLCKKLCFNLDRKGDTDEELSKKIEEIKDLFKTMDINNKKFPVIKNYKRMENSYDTSFIYEFEKDIQKKIAKEGIDDLINTLPVTLAIHNGAIKKVTIIDKINNILLSYTSQSKQLEYNISLSTINIQKNKKNLVKKFLMISEENNHHLLVEIKEEKNNQYKLITQEKNAPNLYVNFPLIGTHEFYFPFIINGKNFEPTEGRNELYLQGNLKEVDKNIQIIQKIYKTSINFIKYLINKNLVSNRIFLASSRVPNGNFSSNSSYIPKWLSNLQKELRSELENLNLVKGNDNNYHPLKNLLLPVVNKEANYDFYDLVIYRNSKNKILSDKNLYEEWLDIISKDYNNWPSQNYLFELDDFLDELNELKNINELPFIEEIKENYTKFDWLNDIYNLVINLNKNVEEYKIFPNQNGDLKLLKDLYTDQDNIIPDEIKHIYNYMKIEVNKKNGNLEIYDINNELLDNKINADNLKITNKNFEVLCKELNEYSLDGEIIDYVFKILSIRPTEDKDVIFMYEKFEKLAGLQIIKINKKNIPDILYINAKKMWFEKCPDLIEGNMILLADFARFLKSVNLNETLNWLNSFINFYIEYDKFYLIENKKIFPNQNQILMYYNELNYENNVDDEFKKIVNIHLKYDIFQISFHKDFIKINNKNISYFGLNDLQKLIEHYINTGKILRNNEMEIEEQNINKIDDNLKYAIAKSLVKIISIDEEFSAQKNKKLYEIVKNINRIIGLEEKEEDKIIYAKTKGFDFSFTNNIIIERLIKEFSQKKSFKGFNLNLDENKKISELQFIKYTKDIIDYTIKYCDENHKSLIMNENTSLLLNENLEYNNKSYDVRINKINQNIEQELLKLESNIYVKEYKKILLHKELLKDSETNNYLMKKLKIITENEIMKEIDIKLMQYKGDKQEKDFSELILTLFKLTSGNNDLLKSMPFFKENKNSLLIGSINDQKKIDFIANILTLFNERFNLNNLNESKKAEILQIFTNPINDKNKKNVDNLRLKETGKLGEEKVYKYLCEKFKNKVNNMNDIKWLNKENENFNHYDLVITLKNGKNLYFEVKSTEFEFSNKEFNPPIYLSHYQLKTAEEICNKNDDEKYYLVRVYNAKAENPKFFFFEIKKDIVDDFN